MELQEKIHQIIVRTTSGAFADGKHDGFKKGVEEGFDQGIKYGLVIGVLGSIVIGIIMFSGKR